MAYIGKTPSQAVRQRYYYTASGSETSLSGADDNSNTLAFSDGEYVDVSLNGVSLVAGTDYNTSTANTIAGLSALAASDVVEIVVYDTFSVHSGTFNGETTFNGAVEIDLPINDALTLSNDFSGSSAGPTLKFNRLSPSPADSDNLGEIIFNGNDSSGNLTEYVSITAVAEDVDHPLEDGKLIVNVKSPGTLTGNEMEISQGAVAFPNREYFHVDLTTLQDSLSDNTTVTVDFGGSGTVKYDTHSKFDSSNDAYLLGSSDGVYLISYSVAISSDVTTTETVIDHAAQVQVATDGSTFASIQGNGGHFQDNAGGEVGSVTLAGTFIYKATTATTKVRLQAYCNTPAVNWEIPDDVNTAQGGTVTGGNDARCTFLSIMRIA